MCFLWLTDLQPVSLWVKLYKTPEALEHSKIIRLSLHINVRLRESERYIFVFVWNWFFEHSHPFSCIWLCQCFIYFSLFIKVWKKTLHAAALENLKVCLSPVPRFSPFFLFWILGLYIWTHCLYLLFMGVLFKVKTFVFKFWDSCSDLFWSSISWIWVPVLFSLNFCHFVFWFRLIFSHFFEIFVWVLLCLFSVCAWVRLCFLASCVLVIPLFFLLFVLQVNLEDYLSFISCISFAFCLYSPVV